MSEASALVPTILEDMSDFTVIATSPAAMETAQKSLILWAARKIQAVKTEIAEAVEQHGIAKAHKWSTTAWAGQIRKHEKRAEFYRKIKMALEAGYYIVPPFPIDVFAIRTAKAFPKRMDSTHPNNHDQPAQILPAGEGRYVDPRPIRKSYEEPTKQRDGTIKSVTNYYAREFQDADFPFKLAKAEIREATDAAMGLKVFDRIGVLPRTRAPDPVVCGQIFAPNQPGYYSQDSMKSVTFFVAWWLDTKTL